MRKFWLLGCLFITGGIFNPAKTQSVEYSVTHDDVNDIRNLTVGLVPFYIDLWGKHEVSMGWGIEGRYIMPGSLTFNGSIYQSYLVTDEFYGENGISKNFMGFEANASYAFSHKVVKQPLKVVLSSSSHYSGGYKYTNTKYIMVDGEKQKNFNLRGGLYNISTPISIDDVTREPIIDTSGNNQLSSASGYVSTTGISAGISYQTYSNLVINVNGYRKSNAHYITYYFDLLFSPLIKLHDIEQDGSYYNLSAADNGIEKKNLGWRFGIDYDYSIYSAVSFSTKMEFGSRPGFEDSAFFLFMSMGMTIHLM